MIEIPIQSFWVTRLPDDIIRTALNDPIIMENMSKSIAEIIGYHQLEPCNLQEYIKNNGGTNNQLKIRRSFKTELTNPFQSSKSDSKIDIGLKNGMSKVSVLALRACLNVFQDGGTLKSALSPSNLPPIKLFFGH